MKMRALVVMVFVVVSVLQVPLHAGQRGADETRYHVRIESAAAAGAAAKLESDGYDVLGITGTAVDLAVTTAQVRALERRGYRVTVVERIGPLPDALPLQPSSQQSQETALPALAATAAVTADAAAALTYRDLDGVIARMHEIAAAHPAIAQVIDVTLAYGTPPTSQGRHLYALKISDSVEQDEDEPAMLIVSAHHAREIGTPVIALRAAEYLTEGYGSDPRISAAVDGHEIWIAPVWNPDGYNHVFTADSLWRKNRRVFTTGTGVDQNRNYPQGWTASCSGSTNPASETHKGPSAGSEPETRTLMAWSERERFAKVIDFHSYGREVLYAYRCLGHPFTAWMQQEAAAISRAAGYGGHTRAPSAEGEHYQWQFARMGAYAFLIETHSEFQPPYESALREAELVWPGILAALERPIPVSGHVTDAVTGLPLEARVELPGVALPNGGATAAAARSAATTCSCRPGPTTSASRPPATHRPWRA